MKIQFMSDLHNEFDGYRWNIPPTDCDLIVLAGDIGNGLKGMEWSIRQSEKLNKPIIYVLGNHDLYNDDLTLYDRAKEYVKGTNVYVLEKDILHFMDYKIYGTTLWTDYCLYGIDFKVSAMSAAGSFMMDHRLIWNEDHIFTPGDALKLHEESLEWLNKELQTTSKKIVVTHHAPIANAIGLKYRDDMMSPAFATDLSGFLAERNPLLWIFGHTHNNIDRIIGNTRVISNQKGYRNEGVDGFNPELVVEV